MRNDCGHLSLYRGWRGFGSTHQLIDGRMGGGDEFVVDDRTARDRGRRIGGCGNERVDDDQRLVDARPLFAHASQPRAEPGEAATDPAQHPPAKPPAKVEQRQRA